MKFYDFGVIAVIVALLIGVATGAVLENDKDIVKQEQSK